MTTEEQHLKDREDTTLGDPGNPHGEAGVRMLDRMTDEHAAVTAWGLGFGRLEPEETILDIGCGGGAALHRMSEACPDGHLWGVDHSMVSVTRSEEVNAPDIEAGKMRIVEGAVEHLPFGHDWFDLAYTIESFYFWPEPVENLSEVRRVLREGGTFLLIADIYGGIPLPDEAHENIRAYHMLVPTIEEYEEMFRKAGFSKTQVHLKNDTTWICVEGTK